MYPINNSVEETGMKDRIWVRIFDIELLLFLSVGVINTIVGLSTIFSLKYFFRLEDAIANLVGYLVGLSVSYVLNSKLTFKYKGKNRVAVPKFAIVFALAYSVNLIVVLVSIHLFKFDDYASHVIGVPVYTLTFYLGSKFFVFKGNEQLDT